MSVRITNTTTPARETRTVNYRNLSAGAVLVIAGALGMFAMPAAIIGPDDGAPPTTPAVITTADTPPKWVLVDDGVHWENNEPMVTCALGTPTSSTRLRRAIDPQVWRTTSPIVFTRGYLCPVGSNR